MFYVISDATRWGLKLVPEEGREIVAGPWQALKDLQDGAALDSLDRVRQGSAMELTAVFEEGRPARFRLRGEVFMREAEDEIHAGAVIGNGQAQLLARDCCGDGYRTPIDSPGYRMLDRIFNQRLQ